MGSRKAWAAGKHGQQESTGSRKVRAAGRHIETLHRAVMEGVSYDEQSQGTAEVYQ